jgi:hypothetical protein
MKHSYFTILTCRFVLVCLIGTICGCVNPLYKNPNYLSKSTSNTNQSNKQDLSDVDNTFLELCRDGKNKQSNEHLKKNKAYFSSSMHQAGFGGTRSDFLLVVVSVYGATDCISVLLENGANPNIRNDFSGFVGKDATVVHVFAANGNVVSLENALKAGGNPNVQTTSGITPLHYARRYGFKKIEKLLLQYGADGSLRDSVRGRGLAAKDVQVEEQGGPKGTGETMN